VEIDRGLHAGLNCAQIADTIGRDRSVVWRECHRNCLPDGDYHALMAQAYATRKARRPKGFKRNGRYCGLSARKSSLVTYSPVARVSRSASTSASSARLGTATPILDTLTHKSQQPHQ